jgi:hypothetical protein
MASRLSRQPVRSNQKAGSKGITTTDCGTAKRIVGMPQGMTSASDLRDSNHRIRFRLQTCAGDGAVVEACRVELEALGNETARPIEFELLFLTRDSSSSAA